MRVVHVIKAVGIAGAERHLITLLSGLRSSGIDAMIVIVVQPNIPMQDYVQALGEHGIPAQTIPIRHHADVGLLLRLRHLLVDLKPDIVHTHLIHADLYGTLAARWAGVPVIISSKHNDDAFRYRKPVAAFNRYLWKMTDAGIAISDSVASFSIRVEGAKPEKVYRIHYGIDTGEKPHDRKQAKRALQAELQLPADSLLIGMVCRLIEQKGVRYGLEAFGERVKQYPQAHLLIAGQGQQREWLETQSRAAGLEKQVHFLGWRKDAPALMAGLDILLAPSLWEGFGLVLLEAMAQQTPIIASAVSAIPEVVVDRETGLLVPPRDVKTLSAALDELLKDAALRQHMGLMGRDRLESVFDAKRMVKETIALYHTVTDGL